MGHVTITTPLLWTICRRYAGTSYDSAVYQIWNLYVHSLWRYERRWKMQKLEWFWGHWRIKLGWLNGRTEQHTAQKPVLHMFKMRELDGTVW